MDTPMTSQTSPPKGLLAGLLWFCVTNRLVMLLIVIGLIFAGIVFAPFDWNIPFIERSPIGVDAIPDIGENQQIVFTEWPGRSPQDIEDQVTYPLTANLLGLAKVRSVRSISMFGFSSVFVIFDDDAGFDWSRAKIIERLNSLPSGTLPPGVTPMLGPDATALGQVFWYTLEGRDADGNPTGGWDLDELRSIQDWTVRYALQSAYGVAEVASIGGFVREYQIDVDPDAMRAADVTLTDIFMAVQASNHDVGAHHRNQQRRIHHPGAGLYPESRSIENTVVTMRDNVGIRIRDIARVGRPGPAHRSRWTRPGPRPSAALWWCVRREPLAAIQNVKAKIERSPPACREDAAGRYGQPGAIVPFYDRTGLIYETLGTLNDAISKSADYDSGHPRPAAQLPQFDAHCRPAAAVGADVLYYDAHRRRGCQYRRPVRHCDCHRHDGRYGDCDL